MKNLIIGLLTGLISGVILTATVYAEEPMFTEKIHELMAES